MGLWDDVTAPIKKHVVDPARSVIRKNPEISMIVNPINAGMSLAYDEITKKDPEPAAPGKDPRLVAVERRINEDARRFRANLPTYINNQQNELTEIARQQANDVAQEQRYAGNARGMLYSGQRIKNEGTARGAVAAELARQKMEVSSEANQLSAAKQNAAAQVGLEGGANALDRANSLYDLALERAKQRRAGLASIGKGVGYTAGRYLGSRGGEEEPSKPSFQMGGIS